MSQRSLLLVHWAIVLVLFILFTYAVALDAWHRRRAATRIDAFEATTGVVTRSDQHGSRTGALHLSARFHVGDRDYAVGNGRGNPEGLGTWTALALYPVGADVVVYYDPSDPANATFTRDVAWRRRATGAAALVAATILFAFAPLITRRIARKRRLPPTARVVSAR